MSESQQVADYSRAVPGLLAPVVVVKSVDETVQNNTLQDDDELKFYVEPYSLWRWDIYGQYTSGTTPDFKFQASAPTGATGGLWTMGPAGGLNTPFNLPYGTPVTYDGAGATALGLWMTGLVIVGATAGFVTLQWAQGTTNASDTKVLKESTLMAWNVTPYRGKA